MDACILHISLQRHVDWQINIRFLFLIQKFCPPVCNYEETWGGIRCKRFCEVSELCGEIKEKYKLVKDICDVFDITETEFNKPGIKSVIKGSTDNA